MKLSKFAAGTICCAILIGAALLISGGILISRSSARTREGSVLRVVDAAKEFQTTAVWNQFPTITFNVTDDSATPPSFTPLQKTTSFGTEEVLLATRDPAVRVPPGWFYYQTTIITNQVSNIKIKWCFGNSLDVLPDILSLSKSSNVDLGDCRVGECSQGSSSACQKQPPCPTVCASKGGVWNANTQVCTATGYLSSVCLLYNQQLNSMNTSRGCYYETGDAGNVLSLPAYNLGQYSLTVQPRIRIQVRGTLDPIVKASALTEGRYNFGPSAEQNLQIGIGLVIGGGAVIWLLIGCAIGIIKFRNNSRGNPGGPQVAPDGQMMEANTSRKNLMRNQQMESAKSGKQKRAKGARHNDSDDYNGASGGYQMNGDHEAYGNGGGYGDTSGENDGGGGGDSGGGD